MTLPMRVPGFPEPAAPPAAAAGAPAAPQFDRRAGSRQLNVRVLTPLLDRHKALIRALDDDGFETNLTEVVQALLHGVPDDPGEIRRAVRAWRRTLDPEG
jgi:hypothetical protein